MSEQIGLISTQLHFILAYTTIIQLSICLMELPMRTNTAGPVDHPTTMLRRCRRLFSSHGTVPTSPQSLSSSSRTCSNTGAAISFSTLRLEANVSVFFALVIIGLSTILPSNSHDPRLPEEASSAYFVNSPAAYSIASFEGEKDSCTIGI